MFYDKIINLLTITEGYIDDWGIYHEGTESVLKIIPCDIQPYSSELLYREYGYQDQVTKRVFCDIDENIQNGMNVSDKNGNRFKIVKVIEWDDYLDVMLDDE
ncbi:MAG: hypothetical protein VB084_13475 [Syntrophomonadaceae bacterium]|nr:hypothetical protein [Syntrophomonadaceae bacterium]